MEANKDIFSVCLNYVMYEEKWKAKGAKAHRIKFIVPALHKRLYEMGNLLCLFFSYFKY